MHNTESRSLPCAHCSVHHNNLWLSGNFFVRFTKLHVYLKPVAVCAWVNVYGSVGDGGCYVTYSAKHYSGWFPWYLFGECIWSSLKWENIPCSFFFSIRIFIWTNNFQTKWAKIGGICSKIYLAINVWLSADETLCWKAMNLNQLKLTMETQKIYAETKKNSNKSHRITLTTAASAQTMWYHILSNKIGYVFRSITGQQIKF